MTLDELENHYLTEKRSHTYYKIYVRYCKIFVIVTIGVIFRFPFYHNWKVSDTVEFMINRLLTIKY